MKSAFARKALVIAAVAGFVLPMAGTGTASAQPVDTEFLCATLYTQGNIEDFLRAGCQNLYSGWDTFGTFLLRPNFAHGRFFGWHGNNNWRRYSRGGHDWNRRDRDDRDHDGDRDGARSFVR